MPGNATLVAGSDQNLTSNTTRTLYANAAAANGKKCAYLCNAGSEYNSVLKMCIKKSSYCKATHYECESPAVATNKKATSTGYTWDCAIDGTTVSAGCSEMKMMGEAFHWECKEIEETHIIPKTCIEEDFSSVGIGPVHIKGHDKFPTFYFEGWVEDFLSYHWSDYLLDWTNSTPVLYIPISYYAGSTSQSATLDLTMNISNDQGTYINVKGTFSVKLHTNADGSNTDKYISVEIGRNSLKYGNNALSNIPCDFRDSCTINITSAKINIPPKSVPCNEFSNVISRKLKCISSYTNQEAFGCSSPTLEEIKSCEGEGGCEINQDNIQDFIRDIRVSNGFRGLFYPEKGIYMIGELIPFSVTHIWDESSHIFKQWEGSKWGYYSTCIGKNIVHEEPFDKNGNQSSFLQKLE